MREGELGGGEERMATIVLRGVISGLFEADRLQINTIASCGKLMFNRGRNNVA